jgi:DNA-binding NarL/FixJ family response regulator
LIRVLICDDHAVVRQGLRTFLDLQEDIEVTGEAADGAEALAAIEQDEPDVVLMDLVMPGMDGIEALRQLQGRTRAIVLSSFIDDDKLFPAVRAGAAGYLLKDVQPQELVAAIRTVHAGGSLLHPVVAARLMEELAGSAPLDQLTAREREVLVLIGRGLANKLIARELGIAEKTVKAHVSSVLAKLGLTDRTQAALFAVREGLVRPGS